MVKAKRLQVIEILKWASFCMFEKSLICSANNHMMSAKALGGILHYYKPK